jgi:hypothetical protein
MAYLSEHRFELGKLAGFVPPAAAALSWPEFCCMLSPPRIPGTPHDPNA